MRLVLVNGNVVTGDGKTIIENSSVVIQDQYIIDIRKTRYLHHDPADKIVDAQGGYIIPGVINNHTHGVSLGPFMPTGERRLSTERVVANLNRHLIQGTTTILNCDGFATMAEVEATNKIHPIHLRAGTSHTPTNFEVAKRADGKGLEEVHLQTRAEEMVEFGAAALGEIGAGTTLGGQGTDLSTLPKAVWKKTGRDISPDQARALKEAVLGKALVEGAFDPEKTNAVLEQAGLNDLLTATDARRLVEDTILATYDLGLKGMIEAAEYAQRLNVPAVMHNAASSRNTILKVAQIIGPKLVAAHSNNTSFEHNEAIDTARQLRKLGAWVDVYSLLKDHTVISDLSLEFFEGGLADLISTDFIGGYHDSILLFIEKALEKEVVELPRAIAMTTSNVARAIPRLAPRRGLIMPGMAADLAVLDGDHISKVGAVIIGGRVVVENGEPRAGALPQSLW